MVFVLLDGIGENRHAAITRQVTASEQNVSMSAGSTRPLNDLTFYNDIHSPRPSPFPLLAYRSSRLLVDLHDAPSLDAHFSFLHTSTRLSFNIF